MSEEKKWQEEKQEGEKELFKIRKTYVRLFWPCALVALYAAIPLLLLRFFLRYNFGKVFLFIWLGLVFLYLAKEIIKWFFDFYIFTNQRIIIAAKNALFKREMSEVYYSEILGVKTEMQGVAAMLFHFGNIEIELKGGRKIILEDITKPEEILAFLQDAMVKRF